MWLKNGVSSHSYIGHCIYMVWDVSSNQKFIKNKLIPMLICLHSGFGQIPTLLFHFEKAGTCLMALDSDKRLYYTDERTDTIQNST